MRYLLHYTQPSDIILDNFGGTGMTAVAASQCENPLREVADEIRSDFRENHLESPHFGIRHAICGDLSPLCFHIASNYNRSVNTSKGDIYEFANCEYHKLLQDRQLCANISEMKASEKKFLKEFDSKKLNSAEFPMLRQVVDKLSQVIERKEISAAKIRDIFTRPLLPREAKREFEKLINEIAPSGSDNIRIILKN